MIVKRLAWPPYDHQAKGLIAATQFFLTVRICHSLKLGANTLRKRNFETYGFSSSFPIAVVVPIAATNERLSDKLVKESNFQSTARVKVNIGAPSA